MVRWVWVCCTMFTGISTAAGDGEEPPRFHDDYYEGFAQGVYYGLLLRGEDYDVAWCMKAELGYEAKELGSGGDFQKKIEGLLNRCREHAAGMKNPE